MTTIVELNASDSPIGGQLIAHDGHGNQLWYFPADDKSAMRLVTQVSGLSVISLEAPLWSSDFEAANVPKWLEVPGQPL